MSIKRIWHRSLYGASSTFHCGSCNYEVMPEWRFCPHCGSEIGKNYLPEDLEKVNRIRLLSFTSSGLRFGEDSPVEIETKMFDMGVPEFLMYHDLVGLIHTDLNQIEDALNTINKSPEFPKEALAISDFIRMAIHENEKTWKGIDSIFG